MSPTNTTHPHISKTPGVCGGEPVVHGTRFPVRTVVVHVLRHGKSVEELVREWPHLTPAQVHDALSYYYDHRDEVEALLADARGG